MSAIAEKTVRELALESSNATRVFEKLGIDYCCGGNKSLEQACRTANLSVDSVQRELDSAKQKAQPSAGRDWQREPLSELIAHINGTHHTFVRQEIVRLTPLMEKVCGKARAQSSGTTSHSGDFPWSGSGINFSHDERGDGPVPVRGAYGRSSD